MIDNIQIVLFFKPNTSFNPNQIAASINKKNSILGNAVVLPVNQNEPNMPIIIFNENKDVNLTVTSISTSLIFFEKDLQTHKKTIIDILNIFDHNSVSFSRIGIIITRSLPPSAIKKLKTTIFKDEEIIEADDFLIAWHNTILLDGTKYNCWERYFINSESKNLMSLFDINTPMEETYYINEDFIDKCITQSIKYVNNKIKK